MSEQKRPTLAETLRELRHYGQKAGAYHVRRVMLQAAEHIEALSDLPGGEAAAHRSEAPGEGKATERCPICDCADPQRIHTPECPRSVRCLDCRMPYGGADWLDTRLPHDQWRIINPGNGREGGGGILCANCIVKRAARLPDVISVVARIEFVGDVDRRAEFPDTHEFVDRTTGPHHGCNCPGHISERKRLKWLLNRHKANEARLVKLLKAQGRPALDRSAASAPSAPTPAKDDTRVDGSTLTETERATASKERR